MKTITQELQINIPRRPILDMYLSPGPFSLLDIETTGLSPAYSSVVLAGVIVVKDDVATLNQFFATGPYDEEEILSRVTNLLSETNYLITYNGRFFDVPFLNKRCVKYNMVMPTVFDLDLFVLFKHYSDIPKLLPKLNQKTIEEYAGIHTLREDRISGGESVDLYNQYLETGSLDLERRILLHNADDLKQLLRLMDLLKNVDIHRAFYKSGFPVNGGLLKGFNLKKNNLTITGISHNPSDYISFPSLEKPYHFQMSKKDGSFEITLPCEVMKDSIYIERIPSLDSEKAALLESFPSFFNNYIILKEEGSINYPTVNILGAAIAEQALGTV